MARFVPGDTHAAPNADEFALVDPSTGNRLGSAAAPVPFQSINPAALYTDQQVVTASAVALTAHALVNGCTVKAKSTNVGKVFLGSSGVTVTDDGSGAGYALEAGEAIIFGVTDCSAIYIIGTAGDVVYVAGN